MNIKEINILQKAYRNTKKEWIDLTPDEKASKLLKFFNSLTPENDKEREFIDAELIIIEEIEAEEIEDHLDRLNDMIMDNALEMINSGIE